MRVGGAGSATPQTRDVLILLESVRIQVASIAHLHGSLARQGPNASADLGDRLHDVCAFRSADPASSALA
jgi:hypothetical protein